MGIADAAHAAQHQHGVQALKEPESPQTLHQRVAALEVRVAAVETFIAQSQQLAATQTGQAPAVGKPAKLKED